MKTLKPFIYFLIVSTIVLSACKKNVQGIKDETDPTAQLKNFKDLVVPADFDWKMTMNSTNSLKAGGVTYYPESGYSTLAFEDLWPAKGDYDFNDLIVEYQFKTTTDESDYITEIVGTFIFRAVGAGTQNGFGFELTGLDNTGLVVTGNSLTNDYVSTTDGWEDGQSSPVIIVAEDVADILPLFSNTSYYGGVTKPAEVVTITITPNPGVEIDVTDFTINETNFNPFMIVDFNNSGRGREVHKIDYPPTDLADLSYFGTADDFSSVTFGTSTYKTAQNFPWVLEIPSTVMNPTAQNSVFFYPIEKSDINWAYLHFADWAESGGTLYGSSPTQWWVVDDPGYRNSTNIYNQTP